MSTEEPNEGEDNIRYFVRIGQTDLDGTKSVERALTGLDGIGRRTARLVCQQAGVDRTATLGRLDEDVIDGLIAHVENYAEEVPAWLTNHQNSYFTGEDRHVTGNDVNMTRRQDINRMQMINSYKGIRHKRGAKVRGQRTKSTGRSEGTIGVNIQALKEEQEAE